MKRIITLFLGILLLTATLSCRKDIGNANWDMSVITPLIKTSLGVNNLLADSILQTNPDTSLKIVYNSTLYDFSVDSLVDIPDTISSKIFHLPVAFTVPAGQQIMDDTDINHLNPGHSAEIRKIKVKAGKVLVRIKNTLSEKMLCTYQIPCATDQNGILEVTELVPAATMSGPTLFEREIDVSGYTINLNGFNGNESNTLTSIIKAWVDPNGSAVTITSSDSLIILTKFNGLVINYAQGYFGTQPIHTGIQRAAFTLFNKITSGTLSLEDLHLLLTIRNGFGVEAALKLLELKSVNTHNGNAVALLSSIINSTIHMNRAQETYNTSNPVIPSVATFNLDNSNFKQLIENLPDSLEYSLDLETNPLGNVSAGNDFVYYGYGFKADLGLEIPLSLVANNLTLTDTISLNISKPSGYEINHGTLTLIADNGFPFSALTQIYLLENGIKTDSLIAFNSIIESAPLDAFNKVIAKKRSIIHVPISGQRLQRLYNSKKMIVVASFNTADQPHYVKIYSDYILDLKLTGDFNMTVNK